MSTPQQWATDTKGDREDFAAGVVFRSIGRTKGLWQRGLRAHRPRGVHSTLCVWHVISWKRGSHSARWGAVSGNLARLDNGTSHEARVVGRVATRQFLPDQSRRRVATRSTGSRAGLQSGSRQESACQRPISAKIACGSIELAPGRGTGYG